MKIQSNKTGTHVMWLSDLHLDNTSETQLMKLLDQLSKIECESVLITGDISTSREVVTHLSRIAAALAPRPIYFVLGNHDYYGSSLHDVDKQIADLCGSIQNLYHLDASSIIPLCNGVGLIGHRGWPDARAGYGVKTVVNSPDHWAIRDFRGLERKEAFRKMRNLGTESANAIRKILPFALTCYSHVVIATHVPPFERVCNYNNRICGPTHLPHYTNISAGIAISKIAEHFPGKKITVLSGHTHSHGQAEISKNVEVFVRGVRACPLESHQLLIFK